MAGSFNFTLTTPQGKLLDIPAVAAVLPAHDGQLGVLPGRAPMVIKLGIGPLRVDIADTAKGQGGSRSFLIEEGFAHMIGDKLNVLTPSATAAETIVESEAQAALAQAERETVHTTDQVALAKRGKDLDRARAAVRLARSGKGI
ncbi:hypothetical protein BH11PLA1_BH11PLA1_18330 [soil metagenome]